MAISIGGGISIGGNVRVTLELPSLVIATNDLGGLTGYSSTALAITQVPGITTQFPPGTSTITFQDGVVKTIDGYDTYPGGNDIFWTGAKTGILFPITLSTT